jgi:predicted dehydrogenase
VNPRVPNSLSRRSFLHGSAALAAAPLVPAAASALRQPLASDADVLKVGLIGCGGRGTGAALQAVRAEKGTVVLTAVADLFADRLEGCLEGLRQELGADAGRIQVAPDHRFLGFDAYKKLIDSGVDVVLLATPPHFRPLHLRAAVDAKKHIFCEKPIAVDAPGVRSVLETTELARAAKLNLMSGFCWRRKSGHRETYKRIHDGAIGDVRAIYSTYLAAPNGTRSREAKWSDMEYQMRNWYHHLWLSGDHVVEQAVHSLDKMAWTMKDEPPLSVVATGGRQTREGPDAGNIWDHFNATFEYKDGVKGFHSSRQWAGCYGDNNDWVIGANGVATINGWANDFRFSGAKPWAYDGPDNDMYQTEHDELFAAIRAGKPINDGVWTAHSTMLAIMVRMSAYTGQQITWDQAMGSTERLGPTSYALADLPTPPPAVPGRTKFV